MRIALFATCVVDQLMPEVGLATLAVLERCGARAEFPRGQTCCGQPFFNAGYRPEARRLARATVAALRGYDAVVVPSGSCAAMIRLHYQELFAPDDPTHEAVSELARRTFEFSQFLVDVLDHRAWSGGFAGPVTVHDGCHSLRELGVQAGPRALLRSLAGCTVVEADDADRCCGFGGTFSVSFDGVSGAMGDAKVRALSATGATVVSCDPSCLLQIRGVAERQHIRLETLHLAQILDRATASTD